MFVRPASAADAPPIQAIYAPIVAETVISFEEVVPDVREMAARIDGIIGSYPYLVAEHEGQVCGYAYASQHRTRAAYGTSVDVPVYVADAERGQGVGRALYTTLLPAVAASGYHAAFAGITLPNDASVALHERFGFTPVGVYREVGRKFDRWLDVGWWQLIL